MSLLQLKPILKPWILYTTDYSKIHARHKFEYDENGVSSHKWSCWCGAKTNQEPRK